MVVRRVSRCVHRTKRRKFASESQRQSNADDVAGFGAGAVTGAAAGAVAGGVARAGTPTMAGMMPMGAMGLGQGGDRDHRAKQRVVTEPNELFGRPEQVVPPVIGEENRSSAVSPLNAPRRGTGLHLPRCRSRVQLAR
jgi:hypothetical protein